MKNYKMLSFSEKVYKIVSKVPKGKVITYKQVATLAGNTKACRAVGNILNKNYNPQIPCHRVIRSDGKIGGYNRGEKKKREILKKEKILVKNEKFIKL
ncbi:MAG: MGMT family protein [Patescibacteria group bacterium]|nr:MGMT family protein [Patescibacteria group bacterium]